MRQGWGLDLIGLVSFEARIPNPQTMDLLGTPPHCRQWEAASQWDFSCSFICTSLPVAHINSWVLPPFRSVVALDSHRSVNPAMNYKFQGTRFHAPYENHPETFPLPNHGLWKNSLLWNQSLVPKKVGDCWYNRPKGISKDTKFKTQQRTRLIFFFNTELNTLKGLLRRVAFLFLLLCMQSH